MTFQDTMLDAKAVESFKDFKGTEDREVLIRDASGVRFGTVFLEGDDWVLVSVPGSESIRVKEDAFEDALPEGTEMYIMPPDTHFLAAA